MNDPIHRDMEEMHLVIGCIVEHLLSGSHFSSDDELCENITKLSGIPKEKARMVLVESKKAWRNREKQVLKV